MKRQRYKLGGVIKIEFDEDFFTYGRILEKPTIAIYDCKTAEEIPDINGIVNKPVLFTVGVYNDVITKGKWPIVGHVSLGDTVTPPTFLQDMGDPRKCQILYHDGSHRTATIEECRGLERATVWEAEHVEERIRDHYAGRPNYWVEFFKLEEFIDSSFPSLQSAQASFVWKPSTDVFDEVTQRIMDELLLANNDLNQDIKESMTHAEFLSFENLESDDFSILGQATLQAFNKMKEELYKHPKNDLLRLGKTLFCFSQLKTLILLDERAEIDADVMAEIRFMNDANLKAPTWFCRFLLEILGFSEQVVRGYPKLSQELLNLASLDEMVIMFPSLSFDESRAVQSAIARYTNYFTPIDGGRIAYSPNFTPLVSIKMKELLLLF